MGRNWILAAVSIAVALAMAEGETTAMRIVNAIPYVVAAPPGLVSSLDLPLTTPHTAFAT